MMIQAGLTFKFSGDSILRATYLINRFPTYVLDHKTPFELLYGFTPSYAHLKTLVCVRYAATLTRQRDKF